MEKIIVTGLTGQAGSIMAEKLLQAGDHVTGIVRRSSTPNLKNVPSHKNLDLRYGDVTDSGAIYNIIDEIRPDIIFHFAAQSHVGVSFENPIYTLDTTIMGTLNILEAVRHIDRTIRIYHAASSEMFGDSIDEDGFQRETTPFRPNSPYAVGKLGAFHLIRQYREAYGIHASNGICFNHESEKRGYEFVTRKITRYVASLKKYGYDRVGQLHLGNLNAKRDWGYCGDYMVAAYLMTQQEQSDDYVIATGETHSIVEFLDVAFGLVNLDWQTYVTVDQSLLRPKEVPILCGSFDKAKSKLNWSPTTKFIDLVNIMLQHDLQ